MGADIYLESINNACREKWEPKFKAAIVKRNALPRDSKEAKAAQREADQAYNGMFSDGYFRDSYNGYGLFAQTKLSWWRDVVPMLRDGYLPIDQAQLLHARVAEAKLDLASARKVAMEQEEPSPRLEEYEVLRNKLLAILELSIKLGEPLCCSL